MISHCHNPRIPFSGDRSSPYIKHAPAWVQGLQLKDLQEKDSLSELLGGGGRGAPKWTKVLVAKFDDLSYIPRIHTVER